MQAPAALLDGLPLALDGRPALARRTLALTPTGDYSGDHIAEEAAVETGADRVEDVELRRDGGLAAPLTRTSMPRSAVSTLAAIATSQAMVKRKLTGTLRARLMRQLSAASRSPASCKSSKVPPRISSASIPTMRP